MKQAVTIMAVVMVALLVVSGFIVSGSIRQQEQLTTKVEQMNELKAQMKTLQENHAVQEAELMSAMAVISEQETALEKAEGLSGELEELKRKYDAQTIALSDANDLAQEQGTLLTTLETENGELKTAWSDAQASADESNGALAQMEKDKNDHEIQCAKDLDTLTKTNAAQETMISDLGAQLTQAEKERDTALSELEALKGAAEATETVAAQAAVDIEEKERLESRVDALEEKNKGYQEQNGALRSEMEAFAKTVDLLRAYQNGELTAMEASEAVRVFKETFPESLLTFLWAKSE